MMIVLVEPEIPQNTGSIARTCAATRTPLHLVGKLGFEITEKRIRRAGLDYWPFVQLSQHIDWESFLHATEAQHLWYFSTRGERDYWDVQYEPESAFVFGSETKGLGAAFLSTVPPERVLKVPILEPGVRSLNLSNCASLVLYEALRQQRQRKS